ncbi:hypothetical protein ACPZMI_23005, partial [Pseudomonas wayambapalatensis]
HFVMLIWNRNKRPETNGGPGFPAKRRAGGTRSHRHQKTFGKPLSALTQSHANTLKGMTLSARYSPEKAGLSDKM